MPIKCEFSELSFAFAYTREALETWGPPGAVPTFPSTFAEGRLGYDVVLTKDRPFRRYFAQFKLVEQINGSRGALRGQLGLPCYHFKLRKAPSMQHRIMLALENLPSFAEVEYVAPRFVHGHDLHRFAAAKILIDNSIRVRPGAIAAHVPNAYDGDTHYVGDNGFEVWAASTPARIDEPNVGDLRTTARSTAEVPDDEWADRTINELTSVLQEVVQADLQFVPPAIEGISPFQRVADFCRAHLGGELIPIAVELPASE